MSTKKSGTFSAKILIDLDEYFKLLTIQDRVSKQEDKINARLEKEATNSIPVPASTSSIPVPASTSSNSSSDEVKPLFQSGSGSSLPETLPFSKDVLKTLTELISNQLKSQYQLIPISNQNSQEGAGATDLISQFPEPISEDTVKPIDVQPTSSIVHKSDLSDNFDDQNLIQLVSPPFKEKAKKLLDELQKHSSDLTWTSKGTIFIDQTSLPESNIFELFPKLFQTVAQPGKFMYLLDVATKIASIGLGKYINRRLISGLSSQKPILNREEIKRNIGSVKHWYFLGQ